MRNIYEMNESEKLLLDLVNKYNNIERYRELTLIKEDIFRREYSEGGEIYLRGIYCPFIYRQLQDKKKLGNAVSSKAKYLYEYGFDVDNDLIYSAYSDEREEFIFGEKTFCIGIEYHNFYKTVERVTVCDYKDGLLMSVNSAAAGFKAAERFALLFYGEKYSYKNGCLAFIETIDKRGCYYKRYHRNYSVNEDKLTYVGEWTTN